MSMSSAMDRTYARGARAVASLALLLVVACSSEPDPGVAWENYSPDLRGRIDGMQLEADCTGLQAEFDQADENDDAQRARTGEGSAALMSYIDDAMRAAGCYGS